MKNSRKQVQILRGLTVLLICNSIIRGPVLLRQKIEYQGHTQGHIVLTKEACHNFIKIELWIWWNFLLSTNHIGE